MNDNPVAEIILRALYDTLTEHTGTYWDAAHAIIAALEGAGWKVLTREPTQEMVTAMHHALYRWREANGDPQQDPAYYEKHKIRFNYAFAAAPSWAGNNKAPAPGGRE